MDVAGLGGAGHVSPDVPPSRLERLWARPSVRALLFLVAGTALHVGVFAFSDPQPGPTIVVSDRDIDRLALEFATQTGRPPDEATRGRLIEREIDDQLLVAEARRLGWHRGDPVVQRRLIQNQRFLEDATNEADADAAAGDAAFLERAYEQGMDQTDVVVKRRLIERMRLAVAELSRRTPPTRDELEAYRSAHSELFRRPARIDFVQVFVSRDRHGDASMDVARALGQQLVHGGGGGGGEPDDEALSSLGDPSLLPMRVRGTSRDELARRFGHEFAAAAFDATPGRFQGPIASSFGLHFVRVDARTEARDPGLDEIEASVRARVERQREQEALVQLIDTLRERARIERPVSAQAGPGSGGSEDGDAG